MVRDTPIFDLNLVQNECPLHTAPNPSPALTIDPNLNRSSDENGESTQVGPLPPGHTTGTLPQGLHRISFSPFPARHPVPRRSPNDFSSGADTPLFLLNNAFLGPEEYIMREGRPVRLPAAPQPCHLDRRPGALPPLPAPDVRMRPRSTNSHPTTIFEIAFRFRKLFPCQPKGVYGVCIFAPPKSLTLSRMAGPRPATAAESAPPAQDGAQPAMGQKQKQKQRGFFFEVLQRGV